MAIYPDDAGTPADLIVQADRGLHRAKAEGKNRVLLPQGERRRHRRLLSPRGATLATVQGRTPARIKNVSEGGLLVSLREAVAVGSAVSLVIERTDEEPLDLRGEVMHVERVPGQEEPAFDVGVRFVEPSDVAPAVLRPTTG
jgi:1-acyl-sn-glycerol-3-phosphate acyltransferase